MYTRNHIRASLLLLVALASTLLISVAVPIIYAPPLAIAALSMPGNDPDEIDWSSAYDLTNSEFANHVDAMKDDYIMVDIEVDEIDGTQRIGATWQRNTASRQWSAHHNLTDAQFHDKQVELRNQGYRLVDQESYIHNDQRYYAGIWWFNTEAVAWASLRNLTSAEFAQKFTEYSNDGFMLTDIEVYSTSAGLSYAMIWVENTANLAWQEKHDLSNAEFTDYLNANKDSYRVWDVESYHHNGVQYYAAMLVENDNGRGWTARRDMNAADFRNWSSRYQDLGYRLVDYESYPTANGQQYAGVWRQNSDRPDWPLKDQVDAIVQQQLDDFNVPGIGVAVAQQGAINYLRGFGYANIEDGVWYSAHTVNRIASLSKPVAGIMALRMVQAGKIANLDEPSRALLPTMPAHHTHTLRQLLAVRGGVGHYEHHNADASVNDTAANAAAAFWHDALIYPPATDCYYTTHGYTVLGAALEGATGNTIYEIINAELTTPFKLTTLRPEDRSRTDANRATLYHTNNREATPDDIRWKILGGGLEASSYDLVNLGIQLLDGSILSQASRAEMWTVPDPTPCVAANGEDLTDYALGWEVGTHNGAPVATKIGNQRGAHTVIRIYPEEEIAIVVLTNRAQGGHSPMQISENIGALMLDAESAPASNLGTGLQIGAHKHRVRGQAQGVRTSHGNLFLWDIGTSGQDGVMTMLDKAALWQADLTWDYLIESSGVISAGVAAINDRGVTASALTLQHEVNGLAVVPTFTAPTYRIQYVLDNRVVHKAEAAANQQAAMIAQDKVWCTATVSGGARTETCDIHIAYQQNDQQTSEWNITLTKPVSMTSSSGAAIFADRVRMVEINAAHAHGAERFLLTELVLKAANIRTVTIKNEHAQATPEATEPEDVSRNLFLPLIYAVLP